MTGPVNGLGALRALPAPGGDEDQLIAGIRSLLPERSAEDRALGVVRVNFGAGDSAETIRVPVLFHAANIEWQAHFKDAGKRLLAGIESDDTGAAMLRLLTGETALQLEMLEAFNPEMLSAEWVSTHATEEQILDAFLGVTAAAFPTPVALARVLLGNRQVGQWVRLQLIQALYSASTSSSPPSTGGARSKSTRH